MNDVLALIYSFILIFSVIAIAFVSYRVLHLSAEVARKEVHVLVSLWVFIMVYAMESPIVRLAGPVVFIFTNTLFVYGGYGRYLGMSNRKRDNGLIYYPISLLILTLLFVSHRLSSYSIIAGVMAMAFGDGFAAVIGSRFGHHQYHLFGSTKSYEGSLVMFVITLLALLLFAPISLPGAILCALIATLAESMTPRGFDNISVPLLTAFFTEVLCAL